MAPLPHSTPEAQGIPSAAIRAFVDAIDREIDALHSFMLVRHGHVVAEGWWQPYRREDRHVLFSLSKSFTASAIGLLVDEGRLSIDDPVLDFFPDEAPPAPSDHLRAMRIRHLLTMTTGQSSEPFSRMQQYPDQTWVELFLNHPVEHEPGTHFLYNSHATYLLSAIVQKLSGQRMVHYLQPRLFTPLGIANPVWETSPQGIDTGGWGLSLTTAEIAAFGQMLLQRGLWQGQRLLPESWVEAATAFQVSNGADPNSDWTQGYGYQFWRCRHNTYKGDGAFGQYCLVLPEQDAVLAMTGGLGDMQPPLNLVWQYLLPAIAAAPLPPDAAARHALGERLSGLRLRPLVGDSTRPLAASVSGRPYRLASNPDRITALCFDFGASGVTITVERPEGEQRIACGDGEWLRSEAAFPPLDGSMRLGRPEDFAPWRIAASGGWTDEATFTAKLWWTDTPFALTLSCRFQGDSLTVKQRGNVGFTATEGPTLTGYSLSLSLDHVVIAVADLDAAIADYRALGFTVTPGGVHSSRTTHNALVLFADGAYLELLARTGEAPQPGALDFGVLLTGREGLVGYALRSDDLVADAERLRALGHTVEAPQPGERLRPDGALLRWQVARIGGGLNPFLIQDITPREGRVPTGAAYTTHANGARGLLTPGVSALAPLTVVQLVGAAVDARFTPERTHGVSFVAEAFRAAQPGCR